MKSTSQRVTTDRYASQVTSDPKCHTRLKLEFSRRVPILLLEVGCQHNPHFDVSLLKILIIHAILFFVGADYRIDSSMNVIVPASNSGDQFCLDVSTIKDNLLEKTEQFELSFLNLPSEFAAAGDPNKVCVNIIDDESRHT